MEVKILLFKSVNNLIDKTKNELNRLNNEYNEMESRNKIRAIEISNAIKNKSRTFNERKRELSKAFDFIRNK